MPIRKSARGAPKPAPRPPRPEPQHEQSPTAIAAEALRTGVLPRSPVRRKDDDALPGEVERIRVGDPDDEALLNEYAGEDTPGGSTPTPDQSSVDEIGRAYGLQDEDAGELRTSSEVMARRDRSRHGAGPGRKRR